MVLAPKFLIFPTLLEYLNNFMKFSLQFHWYLCHVLLNYIIMHISQPLHLVLTYIVISLTLLELEHKKRKLLTVEFSNLVCVCVCKAQLVLAFNLQDLFNCKNSTAKTKVQMYKLISNLVKSLFCFTFFIELVNKLVKLTYLQRINIRLIWTWREHISRGIHKLPSKNDSRRNICCKLKFLL